MSTGHSACKGESVADEVPVPEQLAGLAARLGTARLRERLTLEAGRRVDGRTNPGPPLEPRYEARLAEALNTLLRLLRLAGRGRRNALAIRVVNHDVHLPGLPPSLAGLRLLQISDLHLDMDPTLVHRVAETVAPLPVDACLLTGDYRYRTRGPSDAALAALAELRPALCDDVFAVLGNHDSIRMVPEMERLGVRVLLNESVTLGDGPDRLHLAGVDDPHYFRTHDLAAALENVPDGAATLLLAHSPEVYREAAARNVGLMFCGHTHGGQIRLPGGIPVFINADCPRRMAAGHWRWERLQGYTSVGAGASVLPVRFNCPPEVVLHTLHPE